MLQPARCSHNAHVIPHETSQFLPVVLNHDLFIRVPDTAVVPGLRKRKFAGDGVCNVLRSGLRVDETLEQRVAGHTVRPVQPGAR